MMHSSTICGSMPARRTASAARRAPSSVAVKLFSAPRNLPVGVRTAETMTDSRMVNAGDGPPGGCATFGSPKGLRYLLPDDAPDLQFSHRLRAEQRLQPRQDDAGRASNLAAPLRARGLDNQHIALELDAGG